MLILLAESANLSDILIALIGAGGIGGILKNFLDVRRLGRQHSEEISRHEAELVRQKAEVTERDQCILRIRKEHGDALTAAAAQRDMMQDQIQALVLELGEAVLHVEHFGAELERLTGHTPNPPPPLISMVAGQALSKSGIYRSLTEVEPRTGGKIFFVEDNNEVRSQVSMYLKKHGYEVMTAASVQEAKDHIDEYGRLFNLVLLDLMLGGQTNGHIGGESVADHIRQRGIRVPILLVTAMDEYQVRKYIASTGAVAAIIKPFEIGRLLAAVVEHIRPMK